MTLYLTIGVICGVLSFMLMLGNLGTGLSHILAAIIASVIIVFIWPAWLALALYKLARTA